MNINEFLATEVMGWRRKKGRHDAHGPILHTHYIDPANKDFWLDAHDWNPTENIEQGMMCLDEFDQWTINHLWFSLPGGKVEIHPNRPPLNARGPGVRDDFIYFQEFGEHMVMTLSMAISLACARAKGWKE